MTDEIRQTAAVLPAPRHLRKSRLRAEIPASLMTGAVAQRSVPAAGHAEVQMVERPEPSAAQLEIEHTPSARHDEHNGLTDEAALQRKRRIALAIVILVSVSIPILALTLIFGQ
ncbi:MAG: hypothetical protein J0I04_01130 [Paenarthrobacter ureafaciens]|uniref:hypothetical protein n=1 Tax=Paenarthrobacter ureafaciens TaxID=37931 RepID=UPI001ACAD648|nr:hypothetical protein [Paenarthrobacter ureafaciens]MBN9128244.1 hypothetical protein [Paenarthrobacter ureafaciens]